VKGYVDDTGMGQHLYRVEWLNNSGTVLQDSGYRVLHTSTVPVSSVPAPIRSGGPVLGSTPYWYSNPRADEFVAKRFDVRFGAGEGNPAPNTDNLQYNPNLKFLKYKDSQTFSYLGEYWAVRDHAAAHGWPYEDYMMHCFIDHINSNPWTFVHKFGQDEPNASNLATKGVMIYNGSTWTDESEDAWSTATGDVAIGNNTVYIGYPEPFDIVNVVISTARSGGTVTWQYYKNDTTWGTLSVTDDASGAAYGLTGSGKISFTPPSDWAPVSVNGSRIKFFVRAVVSGAGTPPIVSRLYGDIWLTGGLERGWDANDPNVITVAVSDAFPNGYRYNPTPPVGATAKFRYQGRMRSFWGASGDWFLISHFNEAPDGTVYFGRYLADTLISRLTADPKFNGVFFDNGDTVIQTIPWPDTYPYMEWPLDTLPWNDTNYTGLREHYAKMFTQIRSRIRSVFPNAWVGANNVFRSGNVTFVLDTAFAENIIHPCKIYSTPQMSFAYQ
jgi:hypothetical protein